ncbi:MAG: hypothetical protein KAT32_00045 [Candidatus Moranbacteria bacterium]|nr:hypothetical protein [Candidatus Moranbacteria bacterium]
MATYKQIQEYIKKKYEFTVKTCWIAHVKEMHGLSLRTAPNRINPNNRTNPCPDNKIDSIKDAFHYFKMI